MKKQLIGLGVAALVFGGASVVSATLTTIGTAQFGGVGTEYNLIWDDDNNGNSVIWLDYTNNGAAWQSQIAWASGLANELTYNYDPPYHVHWESEGWRLPATVNDPWTYGIDGTTSAGYNITSSEMGHLFYDELNNNSYYSLTGSYAGDGNWGLINTGDFSNLRSSESVFYWSGTEVTQHENEAWFFSMYFGNQSHNPVTNEFWGLALRTGRVTPNPVPEPATMLLFGTGLVGLVGSRIRKKKKQQ